MSSWPAPTAPVRCPGLPAPAVPGRFKVEPEDFCVDEVPLYEPSGDGDHLWFHVRKRAVGTMPLIDRLAQQLGVDARAFGHAGLKDAFAVTTQWLSVEGVPQAAFEDVELEGVEFLDFKRHTGRLKVGQLRGNRFDLRLRGVPEDGVGAVEANLEYLSRHGAVNWISEQRFGHAGKNLGKGLKVLAGERVGGRLNKRLLRLLVSAVQSEVFNRVLKRRLLDGGVTEVELGDIAWLHRNGACFVVDEPINERTRCARFEISPSGPLPGPKLLKAKERPGAMEAEVIAEMDLPMDGFRKGNEGARRPFRVPLLETSVTPCEDGVRVAFELPRGSYATAVLRELLTEMPWPGSAAAVAAAPD